MLNENFAALESSESDSDLEDALLLEFLNQPNANRAEMNGNFNINDFSEAECKLYFRVEENDIPST